MTSFVLHPEALADVEEIGDHIAADNPSAAAHLIDEFLREVSFSRQVAPTRA